MTDYRALIDFAADQHGLDADLVAAIVEQESNNRFHAYRFEPNFYAKYLATNPMYAQREPREVAASFGLMQVLYTTAVEHGYAGAPWGLFDPAVSLEYGCRVLAELLEWAHGHVRQAVAAYNTGRGGWKSATGSSYAALVMARYDRIRAA